MLPAAATEVDRHLLIGGLSVALQMCSLVPYLIGIFRGKVRPHIFTWLIWSILAGIALMAQIQAGAGAGMWVTATNVLACYSVIALALKYGTRHIVRSDWIALTVALLAIPLWYFTRNPLYSVILICAIDGVAFWPTWRKSWHRPRDELIRTFLIGGSAYLLAIPAMEHFTLVGLLYPLWLGCLNMAFVAMVFVRRRVVNT